MPIQLKKQSRYEGATRSWNVATEAGKPPAQPKESEAQRREREACLSCPLPDCNPYSDGCPVSRRIRWGGPKLRPRPQDFIFKLDLGWTQEDLRRYYHCGRDVLRRWIEEVRQMEGESQ